MRSDEKAPESDLMFPKEQPTRQALLALFAWLFDSALECDRLIATSKDLFDEVATKAYSDELFQKLVSDSQLAVLFPLLAQLPWDATLNLVGFFDCLVFLGTFFNLAEVWTVQLVQLGLYLSNRTGRMMHVYALRTLLYNFNLCTKFATISSSVMPLDEVDILSNHQAPLEKLLHGVPHLLIVDKTDVELAKDEQKHELLLKALSHGSNLAALFCQTEPGLTAIEKVAIFRNYCKDLNA